MNAFITPVSVLDLETVSFLTLRSDTLHTRKVSNDTDVFLSIRCQFRAPVILANDLDVHPLQDDQTHKLCLMIMQVFWFGGAYRDRTDDLLNANQALSRLS